eukprot:1152645-Pelagomonas_calceolata.AAC.1
MGVANLKYPQPDSHARLMAQFAFGCVAAANQELICPTRPGGLLLFCRVFWAGATTSTGVCSGLDAGDQGQIDAAATAACGSLALSTSWDATEWLECVFMA